MHYCKRMTFPVVGDHTFPKKINVNYFSLNRRGSLILNFTIYHMSHHLSRQVILWNATSLPLARTYHTFYLEYLNKQYRDLKDGMVRQIDHSDSEWYTKYHHYDINVEDMVLLSTGNYLITHPRSSKCDLLT